MRRGAGGRGVLGAVGALGMLVAVLLPAPSASAHDYLVFATPAADSLVDAPPDTLTLTFSDVLLDLGESGPAALVQVTGPDGSRADTSCATVKGAVVTVPLRTGVAGQYLVQWRIVSSDGHPVEGGYTFTTTTAQDPPVSPAPVCSGATAEAAVAADDASGGVGFGILLAVAGGIVALVGLMLLLYRWYSRSSSRD